MPRGATLCTYLQVQYARHSCKTWGVRTGCQASAAECRALVSAFCQQLRPPQDLQLGETGPPVVCLCL